MRPVRTVIVEDDLSTRMLLESFLGKLGEFQVVGMAGDGETGVELVRREKPELLLLDLILPREDGLKVLERLRSDRPETAPYIIVISGVGSDVTVQRALELGAGFYLLKPLNLPLLADRLHDRFHPQEEAAQPGTGAEALAYWRLKDMGGDKCTGLTLTAMAAGFLAEGPEGTLLKAAYAEIHRRSGVSYVNAEQSIRRYIERLHRISAPTYRSLMGPELTQDVPPSSKQFLQRLARQLRTELSRPAQA